MNDGVLYLVGTPIGNLEDMTFRAVEVLKKAELIVCEDTRRTRKLLTHFGISKPVESFHAHSGYVKSRKLIKRILSGSQIAYVTDAGMPALADPGSELVAEARKSGCRVTVIPGVSALTTLIAYWPFEAGRFVFDGFLPRKGKERESRLAEIAARPCPTVLFESPARIDATLRELEAACGPERTVLVGREMTKIHEQIEIFRLSDRDSVSLPAMGEYSVLVEGLKNAEKSNEDLEQWRRAVVKMREAGMSGRDILSALKALAPEAAGRLRRMVQRNDD
ncbi:MAG: 16S rRNA (cytidine(1402)-2'-O)-methyltransferase [bacterium]|jgi:16S rRNA (cytidine1402-2'-O)-methyltransferase